MKSVCPATCMPRNKPACLPDLLDGVQAMKQACEILPALADIAETAEVVVGRYPYPQVLLELI